MGSPLALVHGYGFAAEEGVVCNTIDSCEVTGREVANKGDSLVEKHVESHVPYLYALAINTDVVAVIHNEGRKERQVQEPFPAEDEVMTIAATDAYMAYAETHIPEFGMILL